jgi:hypothetical protein
MILASAEVNVSGVFVLPADAAVPSISEVDRCCKVCLRLLEDNAGGTGAVLKANAHLQFQLMVIPKKAGTIHRIASRSISKPR